eukprot:403332569
MKSSNQQQFNNNNPSSVNTIKQPAQDNSVHQKPQRHLQEKQNHLIKPVNDTKSSMNSNYTLQSTIPSGHLVPKSLASINNYQLDQNSMGAQLKHSQYLSNQTNLQTSNTHYFQESSQDIQKDQQSNQGHELKSRENNARNENGVPGGIYQDFLDIDIGLMGSGIESQQNASKEGDLLASEVEDENLDGNLMYSTHQLHFQSLEQNSLNDDLGIESNSSNQQNNTNNTQMQGSYSRGQYKKRMIIRGGVIDNKIVPKSKGQIKYIQDNHVDSENDIDEQMNEDIHDEDTAKSELLRKKPNSATGILGSGAGIIKSQVMQKPKNQLKQINNYISDSKTQEIQKNLEKQANIFHTNKSMKTPGLIMKNDITKLSSPQGFQTSHSIFQGISQGFKTPTMEMQQVLDLQHQTNYKQGNRQIVQKNQHAQQQIQQVHGIQGQPLSSNYTSRNNALNNNTSNQTLKSQNTLSISNTNNQNAGIISGKQSGINASKNMNKNNAGNGTAMSSNHDVNSSGMSKGSAVQNLQQINNKSSQAIASKSKIMFPSTNYVANVLRKQLESPTIPSSTQLVFGNTQKPNNQQKLVKKGKKQNNQGGKEPQASAKILMKQSTTKQSNSNSFMKNYLSVPNIQSNKQSQVNNMNINSTQNQGETQNSQNNNFMTQYQTQANFSIQQARSAQGFSSPQNQHLFDHKYPLINTATTPSLEKVSQNSKPFIVDMKTEITQMLKQNAQASGGVNQGHNIKQLKSSHVKSSYASTTNNQNPNYSSQINHSNNKKTTPKSSFTQFIHISQGEGTTNAKTQDILISHLNDKSREVVTLKNENKELQDRLFQAEKQIIYLAAMQQKVMNSPESIQSSAQKPQKKHFKTLSLKDSHYQFTQNNVNENNQINFPNHTLSKSKIKNDDFNLKTSFTPGNEKHEKKMFKQTSSPSNPYDQNGTNQSNLVSPQSMKKPQGVIKVNLDDQYNEYSAKGLMESLNSSRDTLNLKHKKKSLDLVISTEQLIQPQQYSKIMIPSVNQKLESIFRVMSPQNQILQPNIMGNINSGRLQRAATSNDHQNYQGNFKLNNEDNAQQKYDLNQQQQSFQLMKIMKRVKQTLNSYQQREQILLTKIQELESQQQLQQQ